MGTFREIREELYQNIQKCLCLYRTPLFAKDRSRSDFSIKMTDWLTYLLTWLRLWVHSQAETIIIVVRPFSKTEQIHKITTFYVQNGIKGNFCHFDFFFLFRKSWVWQKVTQVKKFLDPFCFACTLGFLPCLFSDYQI
jgi:hypothetical protein